ncbi:MAG: MBL fold metallo-hydrolase, partial [Bacteroidetes bacterium]|nr:MBL fold metallo-hydrolase [Bacteroidota bacterium]
MRVLPIHTGNFKLDGGAMFGVVPKVIWNKLVPANENNLCNWSMRCLLVEIEDRKILIDTGIGNKQSEKFYGHYDLNGEDSLMGSLSSHGISADQITDVLLTHLHFDHCGGAIIRDAESLIPQFPNAVYHLTESHWNHANNPNDRERASFLPENFLPLKELGLLNFVKEGDMIADCIEIKVFNGHTFGMIAPIIHWGATKLMYMADLIPAAAHIPVNYVMGYDIQPLITMEEKKSLLPWLESEQVW